MENEKYGADLLLPAREKSALFSDVGLVTVLHRNNNGKRGRNMLVIMILKIIMRIIIFTIDRMSTNSLKGFAFKSVK